MSGPGATCPSCGTGLEPPTDRCPQCGTEPRREVETSGVVGEGTLPGEHGHDDGIFAFALRYPLSNDWGPILFGALLTLLSVFVVPALFLLGYSVRVGRAAARGDDAIPDYDDWSALLENGLLYVVAMVPYVLASTVAVAVPFALASQLDGPVAWLLAVVGGAVSVVLGVAMAAVIPTLVATGSVRETYAGLRFARVAFSGEFLVGLFVYVGVSVVLQTALLVVAVVLLVTIVGALVIPFLVLFAAAYTTYVTWALWGYVCWDADDHEVLGRLEPGASLDVAF